MPVPEGVITTTEILKPEPPKEEKKEEAKQGEVCPQKAGLEYLDPKGVEVRQMQTISLYLQLCLTTVVR